MIEKTSQQSSSIVTFNKTETGAVFWVAEMIAIRFSSRPSIWFEANVSSVEVELSYEE